MNPLSFLLTLSTLMSSVFPVGIPGLNTPATEPQEPVGTSFSTPCTSVKMLAENSTESPVELGIVRATCEGSKFVTAMGIKNLGDKRIVAYQLTIIEDFDDRKTRISSEGIKRVEAFGKYESISRTIRAGVAGGLRSETPVGTLLKVVFRVDYVVFEDNKIWWSPYKLPRSEGNKP